jgi:hypothetical protein
MNNKTTQISLVLIVSAVTIGMMSAAAVLLLDQQQQAKALNFNFGGGNFFHTNPKGHTNFKFGGFHIVTH